MSYKTCRNIITFWKSSREAEHFRRRDSCSSLNERRQSRRGKGHQRLQTTLQPFETNISLPLSFSKWTQRRLTLTLIRPHAVRSGYMQATVNGTRSGVGGVAGIREWGTVNTAFAVKTANSGELLSLQIQ